jgi:hypothetical protein
LSKSEVKIKDEAIEKMIDQYAREAGVRSLEKQIKKIMRQVTLQQSENGQKTFTVSKNNLEKFLGKPTFTKEELYSKEMPGISLGLAWTSMGGATMYIEASSVTSKQPGFKQTGQKLHIHIYVLNFVKKQILKTILKTILYTCTCLQERHLKMDPRQELQWLLHYILLLKKNRYRKTLP